MDKGLTEACFKHFLHHRGLASVPGTASPTKRQPPSQRLPDDAKPIPSKTMRITHRSSFQQTTSPKLHPLNKKRPDKSLSFQHLNSSRPQPRNSSSGFYTGHYDTSPLGKSSPRATGSSRSGREHPSAERSSRSDERQPRASSSKTDSHELKQFRCEYCAQIFGRKHHKERHVDNLHRKSRGYSCHLCGSTFHQKPNFQRHLALVHGELPFRCERCGLGFEKSTTLRKHLWVEHGDERGKE